MTLTKIKSFHTGEFDYVNLEMVLYVGVIPSDHYQLFFGDNTVLDIAIDDPTIYGLISAANTAYGA